MSDKTVRHDQEPQPIGVVRILLALSLVGLCIWFIWYNSMQSPADSARRSEAVAAFIGKILGQVFGAQSQITLFFKQYVRKIAHAIEFALLGTTGILTLFILGRVSVSNFAHVAFLVLLVAVADEGIQIFTGRGSSVADVVLDFAGGMAGALISLGVFGAIRGIYRRVRLS